MAAIPLPIITLPANVRTMPSSCRLTECALDRSDKTRFKKSGRGKSIPRGFVPSIQYIPNSGSAAARKTGRYSATRALLRAEVRAPYEQTHRKHPSRNYGCYARLSLARQRQTVGELYRAFGHLDRGLQLASPTFRVVTGSQDGAAWGT